MNPLLIILSIYQITSIGNPENYVLFYETLNDTDLEFWDIQNNNQQIKFLTCEQNKQIIDGQFNFNNSLSIMLHLPVHSKVLITMIFYFQTKLTISPFIYIIADEQFFQVEIFQIKGCSHYQLIQFNKSFEHSQPLLNLMIISYQEDLIWAVSDIQVSFLNISFMHPLITNNSIIGLPILKFFNSTEKLIDSNITFTFQAKNDICLGIQIIQNFIHQGIDLYLISGEKQFSIQKYNRPIVKILEEFQKQYSGTLKKIDKNIDFEHLTIKIESHSFILIQFEAWISTKNPSFVLIYLNDILALNESLINWTMQVICEFATEYVLRRNVQIFLNHTNQTVDLKIGLEDFNSEGGNFVIYIRELVIIPIKCLVNCTQLISQVSFIHFNFNISKQLNNCPYTNNCQIQFLGCEYSNLSSISYKFQDLPIHKYKQVIFSVIVSQELYFNQLSVNIQNEIRIKSLFSVGFGEFICNQTYNFRIYNFSLTVKNQINSGNIIVRVYNQLAQKYESKDERFQWTILDFKILISNNTNIKDKTNQSNQASNNSTLTSDDEYFDQQDDEFDELNNNINQNNTFSRLNQTQHKNKVYIKNIMTLKSSQIIVQYKFNKPITQLNTKFLINETQFTLQINKEKFKFNAENQTNKYFTIYTEFSSTNINFFFNSKKWLGNLFFQVHLRNSIDQNTTYIYENKQFEKNISILSCNSNNNAAIINLIKDLQVSVERLNPALKNIMDFVGFIAIWVKVSQYIAMLQLLHYLQPQYVYYFQKVVAMSISDYHFPDWELSLEGENNPYYSIFQQQIHTIQCSHFLQSYQQFSSFFLIQEFPSVVFLILLYSLKAVIQFRYNKKINNIYQKREQISIIEIKCLHFQEHQENLNKLKIELNEFSSKYNIIQHRFINFLLISRIDSHFVFICVFAFLQIIQPCFTDINKIFLSLLGLIILFILIILIFLDLKSYYIFHKQLKKIKIQSIKNTQCNQSEINEILFQESTKFVENFCNENQYFLKNKKLDGIFLVFNSQILLMKRIIFALIIIQGYQKPELIIIFLITIQFIFFIFRLAKNSYQIIYFQFYLCIEDLFVLTIFVIKLVEFKYHLIISKYQGEIPQELINQWQKLEMITILFQFITILLAITWFFFLTIKSIIMTIIYKIKEQKQSFQLIEDQKIYPIIVFEKNEKYILSTQFIKELWLFSYLFDEYFCEYSGLEITYKFEDNNYLIKLKNLMMIPIILKLSNKEIFLSSLQQFGIFYKASNQIDELDIQVEILCDNKIYLRDFYIKLNLKINREIKIGHLQFQDSQLNEISKYKYKMNIVFSEKNIIYKANQINILTEKWFLRRVKENFIGIMLMSDNNSLIVEIILHINHTVFKFFHYLIQASLYFYSQNKDISTNILDLINLKIKALLMFLKQ